MLLPYRINTLLQCTPVTNWILIGMTSLISLFLIFSDGDLVYGWVLNGWNPFGMIGHVFVHAGLWHLFGNMMFLWVFGNAICGNTSNLIYPLLYFGFGLSAAIVHNVMDGDPAVGASGAINGIVGMATAMYPRNGVGIFYFLFFRAGTFEMPLWGLSSIWLVIDFFRVLTGDSGVAAWAHIGGFLAGLVIGVVFLRKGIVKLTEWDNESLSDWLAQK